MLRFQIKELARIGGYTVKDLTKSILARVLDNELAMSFSWEGAKGKRKFKHLRFATVVVSTYRSSVETHVTYFWDSYSINKNNLLQN